MARFRMASVDRVVLCFFVLFLSVYFLESIGGFYMTSAIVSIEKQFQIPSKVSGMMVSAGDFGYIPAVVFVSYLGSKGNRARWIGGGCTLIAIANLLISSSNFLFPQEQAKLDTADVERSLEWDLARLPANITLQHFLAHLPETAQIQPNHGQLHWTRQFAHCLAANGAAKKDPICGHFHDFLHTFNAANKSEVASRRLLSATSYAFCDKTMSGLRERIEEKRCGGEISNFGPTVTIFVGLLILGVGRTMPFSLGLPLIDDNVKKNNLPLYFAGMFCIRIMGPMLGFMAGSLFNKQYYKLGEAPHGISPRDPLWIGRWWAGFLLIGSLLLLPSLALFSFRNPEESKENGEKRAEETKEGENGEGKRLKQRPRGLALVDRHLEKDKHGEAVVPEGVLGKAEDFFRTMSNVIRQPIYRWAMAGRIIDVFAFKGFHIFMPKYLELQFGIPQYEVNRLMGIIGVLAFAVGVLCGSLAMRGMRLQGRKAATWVAVTGALAACCSMMNSAVGCTSTMTALGDSVSSNFNANSSCLLNCHCDAAPLYPVCDQSGQVFYSPCHAGCRMSDAALALVDPSHKGTPVFDSCMCANNSTRVSREFCNDGNCRSRMYWYFGNMALGGIIGGMGVVPGVLIMLRSVPPKHRSVSLGFNGFLVSLLATLPSPIVWGAIIDHFCLFWSHKCGEKGACALYATDKMRFWIHFLYGGLRIVSLITDLFVIYHAVGLKLTDPAVGEENAEKEEREQNAEMEQQMPGKRSIGSEKGNNLDKEQSEPLRPEHVHNISCAPPCYEDLENGKRKCGGAGETKSSSLPREAKLAGHRRNASRDYSGLMPVGAEELSVFRKSSGQLGGPISEF